MYLVLNIRFSPSHNFGFAKVKIQSSLYMTLSQNMLMSHHGQGHQPSWLMVISSGFGTAILRVNMQSHRASLQVLQPVWAEDSEAGYLDSSPPNRCNTAFCCKMVTFGLRHGDIDDETPGWAS
jgi:hypothetical protein